MRKLYGGFVGGKLDFRTVNDFFGGDHVCTAPAIFTSKAEAKRQYEDVRPVEIIYAGKGPR